MRKIFLALIAIVLCVAICAQPAFAYTIGETIIITAGSIKDETTGSSSTDTRTQSQITADNNNSNIHKSANGKVATIIETIDLESNPIYSEVGGKWVQIFEEDIDWLTLSEIADLWLQISNKGSWTSGETNDWDDNRVVESPSDKEWAALKEIIESHGFGDVSDKTNSSLHTYTKEELLFLLQKYNDLISKYCTSYYPVREEYVPGVYDIIDFDTFEKRGDALYYTLNTYYSKNEAIEILYVVEYSIASTTTNSVRSSTVQKWVGTEHTHFWEGQCIEAPNDGYARPSIQAFSSVDKNTGKATLAFTPSYSGTYNFTATQIKENAYWDAITYNKCEYLIMKDTGQVIWKSEDVGSTIRSASPANPMEGQELSNVHYYNHVNTETVYVTVLKATYVINANPTGSFVPPTAWDEESKTVRIE